MIGSPKERDIKLEKALNPKSSQRQQVIFI